MKERKLLPADFTLDKYGLHVRLVNEDDAAFIVRLRTDDKLGKYIHSTSPDIEQQKNWIREYKKRETEGFDYYFIFYKDGEPFAVNRLYHMDNPTRFTSGSWICLPGYPTEVVVATSLIPRIIAFELLGKEMEFGVEGCHEDNKKVIKFNLMVGMHIKGQRIDEEKGGLYYTFDMPKEDFYAKLPKLENLLNL